jgi:hypothetical protein
VQVFHLFRNRSIPDPDNRETNSLEVLERPAECGIVGGALYLTPVCLVQDNYTGREKRPCTKLPVFFRNRAVDLLIDHSLEVDDLNDASLGTAMDVLYEYGVTELFFQISSTILARQGIDP